MSKRQIDKASRQIRRVSVSAVSVTAPVKHASPTTIGFGAAARNMPRKAVPAARATFRKHRVFGGGARSSGRPANPLLTRS
jgi:hypothetical protein